MKRQKPLKRKIARVRKELYQLKIKKEIIDVILQNAKYIQSEFLKEDFPSLESAIAEKRSFDRERVSMRRAPQALQPRLEARKKCTALTRAVYMNGDGFDILLVDKAKKLDNIDVELLRKDPKSITFSYFYNEVMRIIRNIGESALVIQKKVQHEHLSDAERVRIRQNALQGIEPRQNLPDLIPVVMALYSKKRAKTAESAFDTVKGALEEKQTELSEKINSVKKDLLDNEAELGKIEAKALAAMVESPVIDFDKEIEDALKSISIVQSDMKKLGYDITIPEIEEKNAETLKTLKKYHKEMGAKLSRKLLRKNDFAAFKTRLENLVVEIDNFDCEPLAKRAEKLKSASEERGKVTKELSNDFDSLNNDFLELQDARNNLETNWNRIKEIRMHLKEFLVWGQPFRFAGRYDNEIKSIKKKKDTFDIAELKEQTRKCKEIIKKLNNLKRTAAYIGRYVREVEQNELVNKAYGKTKILNRIAKMIKKEEYERIKHLFTALFLVGNLVRWRIANTLVLIDELRNDDLEGFMEVCQRNFNDIYKRNIDFFKKLRIFLRAEKKASRNR